MQTDSTIGVGLEQMQVTHVDLQVAAAGRWTVLQPSDGGAGMFSDDQLAWAMARELEGNQGGDSSSGSIADIIRVSEPQSSFDFANDALALRLAEEAVAAGADLKLPVEERRFVYMPYMHSESAAVHETAMRLFATPGLETNLEFERRHKAIIDRFGRFPHRNALLGRPSTAEEIEFLKQPGSSF